MRIIPFIQKDKITHLQDELNLPGGFEGVQIMCGTVRVIITDGGREFTSRIIVKVPDESVKIRAKTGAEVGIDKDGKGARVLTLSKRRLMV